MNEIEAEKGLYDKQGLTRWFKDFPEFDVKAINSFRDALRMWMDERAAREDALQTFRQGPASKDVLSTLEKAKASKQTAMVSLWQKYVVSAIPVVIGFGASVCAMCLTWC